MDTCGLRADGHKVAEECWHEYYDELTLLCWLCDVPFIIIISTTEYLASRFNMNVTWFNVQHIDNIGCFFFFLLLDILALARRSSKFVLDFLKFIVTAIFSPTPDADCYTSPTGGTWRNADKASGGVLGMRLSVKQEKINATYMGVLCLFELHKKTFNVVNLLCNGYLDSTNLLEQPVLI
jgi:hypothetical protein